jgi:hypothetical protein
VSFAKNRPRGRRRVIGTVSRLDGRNGRKLLTGSGADAGDAGSGRTEREGRGRDEREIRLRAGRTGGASHQLPERYDVSVRLAGDRTYPGDQTSVDQSWIQSHSVRLAGPCRSSGV